MHLSNNETVPADILLLRSSDPHGVCYIDTCDLDGETNLKRREVVRGFAEKQNEFAASKFTSRLEVDPPSTKIYRFHGAMVHSRGERVPVSSDNLLLRESRLKVRGGVCSSLTTEATKTSSHILSLSLFAEYRFYRGHSCICGPRDEGHAE